MIIIYANLKKYCMDVEVFTNTTNIVENFANGNCKKLFMQVI